MYIVTVSSGDRVTKTACALDTASVHGPVCSAGPLMLLKVKISLILFYVSNAIKSLLAFPHKPAIWPVQYIGMTHPHTFSFFFTPHTHISALPFQAYSDPPTSITLLI